MVWAAGRVQGVCGLFQPRLVCCVCVRGCCTPSQWSPQAQPLLGVELQLWWAAALLEASAALHNHTQPCSHTWPAAALPCLACSCATLLGLQLRYLAWPAAALPCLACCRATHAWPSAPKKSLSVPALCRADHPQQRSRVWPVPGRRLAAALRPQPGLLTTHSSSSLRSRSSSLSSSSTSSGGCRLRATAAPLAAQGCRCLR